MRYAFVAATLALSAVAMPTAAPAKFAIQVTAQMKDQTTPTTLYLGKDGKGTGVEKKEDAASCSIEADKLICDGKTMGATAMSPMGGMDMAPLAAATGAKSITDGFSIDDKGQLHFKSKRFDTDLAPEVAAIVRTQQGGEAGWGLFNDKRITGGKAQLYFELGCHGDMKGKTSEHATHAGSHSPLDVGKNVVVPL